MSYFCGRLWLDGGEGWWVKLDGLTLRNGLCELGWEYKLPEIRENQACSFMGFG